MIKKIATICSIIMAMVLVFFFNIYYPHVYLVNGFYSLLALAIIYGIFKLAFEESAGLGIKDDRTKFLIGKAVNILFSIIFLLALVRIWVPHPDTLIVAFGIVGAGIAVSMQDFFKNFLGGLFIFTGKLFRVGDRIEIGGKHGDVIDISLFYTTLLELKEWVMGDQATGRLAMVPNGQVLSSVVINYNKDHNYIWDELLFYITFESDWKKAMSIIRGVVMRATEEIMPVAEKEIAKLVDKYYLTKRAVEPAVFMSITETYIQLHVRYISDVRTRRVLRSDIQRKVLSRFAKAGNISVGTVTQPISGEIRVRTGGEAPTGTSGTSQ